MHACVCMSGSQTVWVTCAAHQATCSPCIRQLQFSCCLPSEPVFRLHVSLIMLCNHLPVLPCKRCMRILLDADCKWCMPDCWNGHTEAVTWPIWPDVLQASTIWRGKLRRTASFTAGRCWNDDAAWWMSSWRCIARDLNNKENKRKKVVAGICRGTSPDPRYVCLQPTPWMMPLAGPQTLP